MRLSLVDMRRGLERADLEEKAGDLGLPEEMFPGVVRVEARLSVVPGGWRVVLAIETAVHRVCDRCLAESDLPCLLDEQCLVVESAMAPAEDDDRVLRVDAEQEWVLLDQVVLDALRLAQPEYFSCREDCRGLCPHCGLSLNEGDCGCRPAAPDSPFQALARLRRPDGT